MLHVTCDLQDEGTAKVYFERQAHHFPAASDGAGASSIGAQIALSSSSFLSEDANKNEKKETQEERQAQIRAGALAVAFSDLTASDVQSQEAAKWKRAAFNIDDETEDCQSKKQKFTFKSEISIKEQTPCCTKNCSQKAIPSWASNLNPGYYRNVCFKCQQDEIGELPGGVDSITTDEENKTQARPRK